MFISIVILFLVWFSISSSCLDITLRIIGTTASVGTLIIAIMLFDQFGLRRSRKLKEVELAKIFYEKLKNVSVFGYTKDELPYLGYEKITLNIMIYYNLTTFETEILNKKNVVFTTGYCKFFNDEITKIVENIFFPQELYNCFKFINFDINKIFLTEQTEWDLDECIFLSTLTSNFDDLKVIQPIGFRQYKFSHIITNYKKLIIETERYLEENGYKLNKKSKFTNQG